MKEIKGRKPNKKKMVNQIESEEVPREDATVIQTQQSHILEGVAQLADVGEEKEINRYDSFSRAPFLVMIRKVSAGETTKKQIPAITAASKLAKANIRFNQIEKYFNTWKITFQNETLANSSITNKYLKDMGFVAFIPKYKTSCKIVIRDIPTDMSLAEVKTAIEDENANIVITKMFRMKTRDRITRQLMESESICLEIKGENLPKKIHILKTVNKVYPYIPSVRVCYKCGTFGHISKWCNKIERCLICAGDHTSTREKPCNENQQCINCRGSHSTMNRACPVLNKQKEIARVMAIDNLPFLEARKLVEHNSNTDHRSFEKSLGNFPRLDEKTNSVNQRNTIKESPIDKEVMPALIWNKFKEKEQYKEKLQELINKVLETDNSEDLLITLMKTIDMYSRCAAAKGIKAIVLL